MIKTSNITKRRTLHFSELDDCLACVDQLASSPHHVLGNWSLAQNLDHLARSIDASYEGFDMSVPIWARWFIAPFIKNRFLTKPMPAGFKLKAGSKILPEEIPLEDAVEKFRSRIERLKSEPPTHPHPLLGKLAHQEWQSLALRHAELHLSFVIPDEA